MNSTIITVNFKGCSKKIKMNENNTANELRQKLQIPEDELFLLEGSIIESHLEQEFIVKDLIDNKRNIYMNSTLIRSIIYNDDIISTLLKQRQEKQEKKSPFQYLKKNRIYAVVFFILLFSLYLVSQLRSLEIDKLQRQFHNLQLQFNSTQNLYSEEFEIPKNSESNHVGIFEKEKDKIVDTSFQQEEAIFKQFERLIIQTSEENKIESQPKEIDQSKSLRENNTQNQYEELSKKEYLRENKDQNQPKDLSKDEYLSQIKEIVNEQKINKEQQQNRPQNFDQRLKRIPQDQQKINMKKTWWESTFNNQWPNASLNKHHFSIVIGNSQQGKDTFIANLDPELLEQNLLKLGSGNDSCTKQFEFLDYKNSYILNRSKGVILNTLGLGDTKLEKRDDEIVFEIFRIMMEDSSKIAGGINTFYFVQSLTTEPVGAIERSMILMEAALGKEIFKSSVIIATKGNNIIDERQLESGMNYLKDLAKKYNVQGGVIDYRAKHKFQGEGEIINPLSEVEEKEQQDELRDTVQSLPFYSLKPLFNQLKEETEKESKTIKEESKQTKIVYKKKIGYERNWYTLWLVKESYVYYDQEYEDYYTKNDESTIQEATKKVLQQNLELMKIKLENTRFLAKQ